MNVSEIFIRKPIGTSLLMAGILVFGIASYQLLPVAALPTVDFPTITVSATLPGASPDTMASSVATPLEQQFATIPGLAQMTSTSGLGTTSITLQFDLNRNIDGARRRRADRDQRGERSIAERSAEPANLSEDQPGRPRDPDLCRLFRCASALPGRRLRLHDHGAADLANRRGVAGRHRRPAAICGACAGQSDRARIPRYRLRRCSQRAVGGDPRTGQGQSRRSKPDGDARYQRSAVQCRCVRECDRGLPQWGAGTRQGRRPHRQFLDLRPDRRLVQRQAGRTPAGAASSRR